MVGIGGTDSTPAFILHYIYIRQKKKKEREIKRKIPCTAKRKRDMASRLLEAVWRCLGVGHTTLSELRHL